LLSEIYARFFLYSTLAACEMGKSSHESTKSADRAYGMRVSLPVAIVVVQFTRQRGNED
jgi:hypothetical protein